MPPSRRARIGIANGWLSEEIPFIFLFGKRKMWNDADGLCFLVCCSPTAAGRARAIGELQSAAWGGGELRDSASRNIHMRQPIPRQKRFRIKGDRSDEA